MLTSDDMTEASFVPLWEDAVAQTSDIREVGRLCLEYGRLRLRTHTEHAPLLVARRRQAGSPLVVLPLPDVPGDNAPELKTQVQQILQHAQAYTAAIVFSQVAGQREGVPHYLLTAWVCERGGGEFAVIQPYRWLESRLAVAPAMVVPDATLTEVSRRCAGIFVSEH